MLIAPRILRRATPLALLIWLTPSMPAPALGAPTQRAEATGITVDLDDGRILAAEAADAPRWPASLAKLMTAYLAFEALEAGTLSEETPVTISKAAAGQRPVKAWLQTGNRYRFGEVLSAAIVASANDAAYAVAEAVAGSEKVFVDRMNQTAARLGMSRTRFANPHGLPRPGQQTTARDIARLALALMRDYPARAALFSARSASLGGRRLSTTNPLFGRYAGALGMKTGFTCRAGYSIAALAERDGRKILSVTLAARNSNDRLKRIRAQLDAGFAAGPEAGEMLAAALPAPIEEKNASAGDPPSAGVCVPGAGGGGSPSGWAVFLGARANRGWATRTVSRASGRVGGASYVGRRKDRRWAAMLHGFTRKQAIRACAALRRRGDYCLTLSPRARRIRASLWR